MTVYICGMANNPKGYVTLDINVYEQQSARTEQRETYSRQNVQRAATHGIFSFSAKRGALENLLVLLVPRVTTCRTNF